jgi:lysozyme
MDSSRSGRIATAQWEACVLRAYRDGDGWAIGFGLNHPGIREGDTISLEQAFADFKAAHQERARILRAWLKVPLEQHQFDAIVDFIFNDGNVNARRVIHAINVGRVPTALDILMVSNKNKTDMGPGLKKRRVFERHLFETGDYGDLSTVNIWYSGDPRDKANPPDIYIIKPEDFA